MQQSTSLLDVQAVHDRINNLLEEHFALQIARSEVISPSYQRLWQTIRSTSLAGGKRLRPYLVYLSYAVCGGAGDSVVFRVGTAVELLHLCMLAHDDIVDRDFMRHNIPNIAGAYRQIYQDATTDPGEATHFANSAALLAGDVLLSDAYQFLIATDLPPATFQALAGQMQTAVFSVAGGELIDTEAPLYPIEQADSLVIAEYKTAYYSCAVPMAMGAILAGSDEQTVEQYTRIGKNLGIAYQLTDDLLGTFGDEQQTGKSNMSDLQEAKRTYLLQKTFELASPGQRQLIDNILQHERHDNAKLNDIKHLMRQTGAVGATQELIAGYVTKAKQGSAHLQQTNPQAEQIDLFIDSLVGRPV